VTPVFKRALLDMLEKHEGCETCLYLDTKDVVSVGVGHACFSSQEAARLPFLKTINYKPANPDEVVYAWASLKYQSGTVPKLRRHPGLIMERLHIEALLLEDIKRFQTVLANTFPEYDSYPDSVRLALFDMAFNLGSLVKFPRLTEAVKARDWEAAAEQCVRRGIGNERNADTKKLFLSALPDSK
jgi:GH24 family phage-related lysozyme (muramidase)